MEDGVAMRGGAKIGCIGDLLVELVCTTKNGRHRRLATYIGPFPSGAAGIFIDQAAQAGGRCIFVGAVGDDAFGRVVLDRLIEHGVDTRLIKVVKGVPTGTAFVSYNDDGSRDFVYNIILSAAAQFDADEPTLAALEAFGLDFMHVSGSALGDAGMAAKVLRTCKSLHAKGVKISFDPNVRKELIGNPAYFDSVREMIGISSVFLPSEEDAATLFPGKDLSDFASDFFSRGADYVVLKKGENGCEGVTREGERVSLPAHKVEVQDPTGAGDCFCATFVTLIASGAFTFRKAMERANAAGALAVTKVGPMEGNSSLATLEAFLAKRS
jgi:sugar/nucleoside kinase (ribokinase family)